MSTLQMAGTVFDAIRKHGEGTYPHEYCGVLLGQKAEEGWRIESSIEAGNTRTDSLHNRYSISPGELIKIECEARRQGLNIDGFYHSHPDHLAQCSPTDFAETHWIGCSYLITAVAQGKPP